MQNIILLFLHGLNLVFPKYLFFIVGIFFIYLLKEKAFQYQNFIFLPYLIPVSSLCYFLYDNTYASSAYSLVIFFTFLLLFYFFSLIIFLIHQHYKTKKSLFSLFLFCIIYNCCFFIFSKIPLFFINNLCISWAYPLLSYLSYQEFHVPLLYFSPWIFSFLYFFLISVICHYTKKNTAFLIFLFLHGGLYTIGKKLYKKDIQLSAFIALTKPMPASDLTQTIENIAYQVRQLEYTKKTIITPEGYSNTPLTMCDLQALKNLLPRESELLLGCYFKENNIIYNTIASLSNTKLIELRHKKTVLPLVETNPSPDKNSDESTTLFICSEFLCGDRLKIIPYQETVCLASDSWTNHWYGFYFKKIMILLAYLQALTYRTTIHYCSQSAGLISYKGYN